jgi:hypothetical protein
MNSKAPSEPRKSSDSVSAEAILSEALQQVIWRGDFGPAFAEATARQVRYKAWPEHGKGVD